MNSSTNMKTYNCINCNKECIWRRQKINKYCSISCQHDYQYKTYIDNWKQGIETGNKGKLQTSGHIHKYILEKQDYKCSVCFISKWNGIEITLELDHIDGNSSNNKEYNLRAICPNCHSQTPTYKAKNKGNGRKLRQKI